MANVLIVDDDAAIRRLVERGLEVTADGCDHASDGETAMSMLDSHTYDIVITDLRMAGMDGLRVLDRCLQLQAPPAVIMMSGHGTIEIAIDAVKRGAFDFVAKPFQVEHLELKVAQALEMRRLRHHVDYLTAGQSFSFDQLIGSSGSLRRVLDTVRKVARSHSTILIRGETGTGKELIAAALHSNSDRASRAFVKVNCAALHENLLESELFGHEKGAFTGADRLRIGRFEQAHGGTLFLDEVGDMSPSTQAKVLRVLQEHEFERLGSSKTIHVDVRVIAATHRDLSAMVKAGDFRVDLLYRLNVVVIELPPLRERKEDIPALVRHIVTRLSAELKRPAHEVGADVLSALASHEWPGNIRELQNVIERALLLADGPILRLTDVSI